MRVNLDYKPLGHKCNCRSSSDEVACPTCVFIGRQQENQRIIELLEDPMWHDIAYAGRFANEVPVTYHDGECLGCRQIALIKGENK